MSKRWCCYLAQDNWTVVDMEGHDVTPPDTLHATKREALAEAIRQNEGLASALTLEIARLKEELAACKD